MRFHYYAYRSFLWLADIVALAVAAIHTFALEVLRIPYVAAIDLAAKFKISDFRIVSMLRPVYRDSYLTDGHSLAGGGFRS